MREKNKTKIGILCAVGAACLFGFSVIFTKKGVSQESVLTLISWRFLVAFLTMTLLIRLGLLRVDLKNKPVWGAVRIAVFTPGIYFLAEGKGLQLTAASEGATILAMEPIVIMLLAALVLKEYPTIRQALSIAVSVAGVVVIILSGGAGADFVPAGYLILFLAITADSINVILTRKYVVYTPAERVYVMAVFGTVLFIPLALVEHAAGGTVTEYLTLPLRSPGFLTAILYLGVVTTAAGFTLNAFAIRYLGPNRLVSFSGISTFTTVFVGVMFLRETFTVLQAAGTALILFGAWNANREPSGGSTNQTEREEER